MLWLRHLEIFWYFLRHVSDFWSWILRSVAYTHRAQGKKKSRRSWRCRKETAKDWKDKRTSAQKAIVVIRCVFWDFLRLFEGPLISPSRPCGACGAPCGSCRIGSTSWTSWTSWTSQSRRVSESAHHTSRVLHVYYTYHTPQTPIPRAQTLSWTLSDQILSEFQYRPNVKSLFGGGDHTKYSTIEAFAWTMHFDIPEWALRQTTLTLRVVRCCQDHCNQFRLVTFGQIWSDCHVSSSWVHFHLHFHFVHFHLPSREGRVLRLASCDTGRGHVHQEEGCRVGVRLKAKRPETIWDTCLVIHG